MEAIKQLSTRHQFDYLHRCINFCAFITEPNITYLRLNYVTIFWPTYQQSHNLDRRNLGNEGLAQT